VRQRDNRDGPTRSRLRTHLAKLLGIEPARIDDRVRFHQLGLDSTRATAFTAELATELDRFLPPTLLWDHPTLDALVAFLEGGEVTGEDVVPIKSGRREEPIAIVGLSCRFPGGTTDPDTWFTQLCEGFDAVSEFPPDRGDIEAVYDPEKSRPGTTNARRGAFLDDVRGFDPLFFGISPREAVRMDPQQRLMMELAWEGLEHAHIVPSDLLGRPVGVFIGAMWDDYARLQCGDPEYIVQHTATGLDHSIIAARISYTLGLMGPSLSLNTACSSALVALHLAIGSLRSGESELALAGGVNLILANDSTVSMAQFGGLSPDGRAKAFDARANGYVRGEGAGLVVLAPLSRALAEGFPIHCVVRGTAVNNDGFSNGLTAPNPRAQEMMLRAALADAGTAPHDIHYVEAHGTGTLLGDPIEAGALGAVLGRDRGPDEPLLLGSVKTNIGHTEAAAGVAGLIKTALAVERGLIPPSLHFETPNPGIPFEKLGLRVNDRLSSWPDRGVARAGVSSFGFGGTNCHAVLEAVGTSRATLIPLAAESTEALTARAQALADWLEHEPTADLCAFGLGAVSRLAGGPCRTAVVAERVEEAVQRLHEVEPADRDLEQGVVFVFSGQGSHWPAMGHGLFAREPVFAARIRQLDPLIEPLAHFRPSAVLAGEPWDERDASVLQPLLFAIQLGLVALWRDWGLEPVAVVGHSLGEVAAAHTAGILDLDDAVRVVCHRSALMQRVAGKGAMLVIRAGEPAVIELLAEFRSETPISIACTNDPTTTVVSGTNEAIADLTAFARSRSVECNAVRLNIACHSAQMDALVPELGAALDSGRGLSPRPARLPIISSVTGDEGASFDTAYWQANLRETVRFSEALQSLIRSGRHRYLEIGAHGVLSSSILRCIGDDEVGRVWSSMRRDADNLRHIRETVADIFSSGADLALHRCFPAGTRAHVPPPLAHLPAEAQLEPGPLLFIASAHSDQALRQRVRDLLPLIDGDLLDLSHTLACRRTHHRYRLALPFTDRAGLREGLERFSNSGEVANGSSGSTENNTAGRVAFVFPGQGSQWLGMGRALYLNDPAFRATLLDCDRAFAEFADFSVRVELFAEEADSRLEEVDVIQPMIFAIQIALAGLWRAWGIEPDAVVGHSMGEVAAAYVAGALDLRDAARIICLRSKLAKTTSGNGAMALVEASPDALAEDLADRPGLSIAAVNGPSTTLLSGVPAPMDALLAELEARDIFCRRIVVDYASHCAQMDPLLDELRALLAETKPRAGDVPIYSTATDTILDGSEMCSDYWARNLREPVMFYSRARALIEDGTTVFIEISPHPVMALSLERTLEERGADAIVCGSLRREENDIAAMMAHLAPLHILGLPIRFDRVLGSSGRPVPLPNHPWQRRSYWPDLRSGPVRLVEAGHPLAGSRLSSPLETQIFRGMIEPGSLPWLADHVVMGKILFPATAFLEIFWTVATASREQPFALADFLIEQGLPLEPGEAVEIQTLLDGDRLAVHSRSAGSDSWTRHATCRLVEPLEPFETLEPVGAETISVADHYRHAAEIGLEYGPAFQGITAIDRVGHRAGTSVSLPVSAGDAAPYVLHPALTDACLQGYLTLLEEGDGTCLPLGLDRFCIHEIPSGPIRVEIIASSREGDGPPVFDLKIAAMDGTPIARMKGLSVRAADPERARQHQLMRYLHQPGWAPLVGESIVHHKLSGTWLITADPGEDVNGLCAAFADAGASPLVVRPTGRYDSSSERGVDLGDHRSLIALLEDAAPAGLLWRAALRIPSEPTPAATHEAERVLLEGLSLIKALARTTPPSGFRLVFLTRGACPVGEEGLGLAPARAAVRGFATVLGLEHPEFAGGVIDLDPDCLTESDARLTVRALRSVETTGEIAIRSGKLYRQVLHPHPEKTERATELSIPDEPFRLTIRERGFFEGLSPTTVTRMSPGPGEVEIRVRASGQNFRDVMSVLGTYPGDPGDPGLECAGEISGLGDGVTGLAVGDPVFAPVRGGFARYVIVDARLAVRRPTHLHPEEAAGIPIVFMTAFHGLRNLASLKAGETILIQSAAGGVGLAALQIARMVGAEVIATAGTEEKRDYLRSYGLIHVFDSRTLDYVARVREVTGGRGVDVVLNSLAGEHIRACLDLLVRGGRFIEIGKTGIATHEEVAALDRGIAYHPFDLLEVIDADVPAASAMLSELADLFARKALRPIPTTRFPFNRAVDAFRFMASGEHLGKIVLSDDDRGSIRRIVETGGAVLITGGTGGLGLLTAKRLVERGVRHLVLASRSGKLSEHAENELYEAGASVRVVSLDVTDGDAVTEAIADIEREHPLRGVIHAAGVLRDGMLMSSEEEDLRAVLAPKLHGGANLVRACRGLNPDLFVWFSSVAALMGLPGQSGYAAANAFLDALAHRAAEAHRLGTSIGWGPWQGVGMLAGEHPGAHAWSARGVGPIPVEDGLDLLELAIGLDTAQLAVFPIIAERAGETPLLRELRGSDDTAGPEKPCVQIDAGALQGIVDPAERRDRLHRFAKERFIEVMGLPGDHEIESDRGFREMGMDSLMSIAFRNTLQRDLDIPLPATLAFNYPTLTAITAYLSDALAPVTEEPEPVEETLDDLTSDDLADLLEQELEGLIGQDS